MTAKEIRQSFLEFFKEKKHEFISSSPMVVKDDPTLMFINAGMNQFKDLFLGNSEVKHTRVCNSQKCLRVSGKHNDFDEKNSGNPKIVAGSSLRSPKRRPCFLRSPKPPLSHP